MPAFSALVLFAWSLVALGAPHNTPRNARHAPRLAGTRYTLQDHYTGKDFLDWNFFSEADPTHGNVNFLNKADAMARGLAVVQLDGTFVMSVDNKTKLNEGVNRDSVRISSPKPYLKGLFIASIFAMAHGSTVWPAYWTVGPDWPNGGEVDILEGVGNTTENLMSLHTSEGCMLNTAVEFTGTANQNTDCNSSNENNDGCGITNHAPMVYGHGWNMVAGGVMAHTVSDAGIKIWHFPRTAIPEDITNKRPNPNTWGTPAAFWSADTCPINEHFSEQFLTFDTTICGDWAGNVFTSDPKTSMAACVKAVEEPSNYDYAQWMLDYVETYAES